VVPVLERCQLDATLQVAKAQHSKLPPLRLGVTLPSLRFFISPARLHRVMRILHAALPSALDCAAVLVAMWMC
jgi:Repeating coiled region of VPS13